jgi:hypothetical protein
MLTIVNNKNGADLTGADLTRADMTWGRFDLLPWITLLCLMHLHKKSGIRTSRYWTYATCHIRPSQIGPSQIGPIFVVYYCQHAKLNSLNTISWLGYLDALFLLKGQFIDNRKNHQRMLWRKKSFEQFTSDTMRINQVGHFILSCWTKMLPFFLVPKKVQV